MDLELLRLFDHHLHALLVLLAVLLGPPIVQVAVAVVLTPLPSKSRAMWAQALARVQAKDAALAADLLTTTVVLWDIIDARSPTSVYKRRRAWSSKPCVISWPTTAPIAP